MKRSSATGDAQRDWIKPSRCSSFDKELRDSGKVLNQIILAKQHRVTCEIMRGGLGKRILREHNLGVS